MMINYRLQEPTAEENHLKAINHYHVLGGVFSPLKFESDFLM